MADYQARGWLSWNHHMALVSMALLFILREREVHQREIELLSSTDVIEMLSVYLPRKEVTPQEVMANIERRHQKRKAAIESAKRRARAKAA